MAEHVPEIDCLSAVRQLWDYLDEELNASRMAEVRQHLEHCQRCLPHADFSRWFLEVLHETQSGRVMPSELRARVMAKLTEAGFAARE
jgi:mycothiol system anti-sigma-R factor